MVSEKWTVGRLIDWATPYLTKAGSSSARLDAEVLLACALHCQRVDLYLNWDKPLKSDERRCFKDFLGRRSTGEPVAYITGYREFFGNVFAVSPAVLIPRPDTEIIMERLIAEFANVPSKRRILDIGTGSGCLAVSTSLRFPDAQVEAWDVEEAALVVARKNAATLGANCDFRLVDALRCQSWDNCERFHFIISNPPYVTASEYVTLEKSIKNYEPKSALVGENDGLIFYENFASNGSRALAEDGKLLVEVGCEQGAVVRRLLESFGWRNVEIIQDYAKLDRAVIATKPAEARNANNDDGVVN